MPSSCCRNAIDPGLVSSRRQTDREAVGREPRGPLGLIPLLVDRRAFERLHYGRRWRMVVLRTS